MNQHDSSPETDHIAALPRLACDQGGPVFAEPWQAQAFALAVKLSEQGHFTWKEWAAALADELKAAAARAEPDNGSHCYEHWLATLERLVTAKGLSDPAAMAARRDAWADAYRHTPYGEPVELGTAWVRDAHEHQPDLKLWKSGNYQEFLPSACERPRYIMRKRVISLAPLGPTRPTFSPGTTTFKQ